MVWDGLLSPGEMLYLPRGYLHHALADAGTSSLHLSLSTEVLTWQLWEGMLHCAVVHLRPPLPAEAVAATLRRDALLPCWRAERRRRHLSQRRQQAVSRVGSLLAAPIFLSLGAALAAKMPDAAGVLHAAIRCAGNRPTEPEPLRRAPPPEAVAAAAGADDGRLAEGWAGAVGAVCARPLKVEEVMECALDGVPGLGGEMSLGAYLRPPHTHGLPPPPPPPPLPLQSQHADACVLCFQAGSSRPTSSPSTVRGCPRAAFSRSGPAKCRHCSRSASALSLSPRRRLSRLRHRLRPSP